MSFINNIVYVNCSREWNDFKTSIFIIKIIWICIATIRRTFEFSRITMFIFIVEMLIMFWFCENSFQIIKIFRRWIDAFVSWNFHRFNLHFKFVVLCEQLIIILQNVFIDVFEIFSLNSLNVMFVFIFVAFCCVDIIEFRISINLNFSSRWFSQ